jgi:non-homologous end joining protein Ku
MVELAEHILDMKAASFAPTSFQDRYETALKALTKRKAAGKKIVPVEPASKSDNVVSLMDALRKSLGNGKRAKGGTAPRKRGKTHARGRAA